MPTFSPPVGLHDAILALETREQCEEFLRDILTDKERAHINNRWQAMLLIHEGVSQRKVRSRLGVGIATASRAARVLRNNDAGCARLIKKLMWRGAR